MFTSRRRLCGTDFVLNTGLAYLLRLSMLTPDVEHAVQFESDRSRGGTVESANLKRPLLNREPDEASWNSGFNSAAFLHFQS